MYVCMNVGVVTLKECGIIFDSSEGTICANCHTAAKSFCFCNTYYVGVSTLEGLKLLDTLTGNHSTNYTAASTVGHSLAVVRLSSAIWLDVLPDGH